MEKAPGKTVIIFIHIHWWDLLFSYDSYNRVEKCRLAMHQAKREQILLVLGQSYQSAYHSHKYPFFSSSPYWHLMKNISRTYPIIVYCSKSIILKWLDVLFLRSKYGFCSSNLQNNKTSYLFPSTYIAVLK